VLPIAPLGPRRVGAARSTAFNRCVLLTLEAPKASFVSALYVALFFPRRRQGASRCALPFAAATAGELARWQTAELVHCRAAAARPEDLPQALQNTMPVKQPRRVRQHGPVADGRARRKGCSCSLGQLKLPLPAQPATRVVQLLI